MKLYSALISLVISCSSLAANTEELTTFKTTEITTKKNLKAVRTCLKNWGQLAAARAYIAILSSQIESKEDKSSAAASYGIISSIDESLKHKSLKVEIHVALDEANNIQAIGITRLAKGCNYLELLATNPENIQILGYEKPVRGAGTALIAHIANKILQKQEGCKKLHLFALDNALSFYHKIGFVDDTKNPDYLMLKRTKLKSLVQEYSKSLEFLQKEPKLTVREASLSLW